jgi:hypothetical protein
MICKYKQNQSRYDFPACAFVVFLLTKKYLNEIKTEYIKPIPGIAATSSHRLKSFHL